MARTPIYAAGGIVMRGRKRLRVAVVQRSKDGRWVLPRGKLKRNENPLVGARREVVEETGHRVRVHEFLGAITYRTRGRSKVVQFWRMQANARPSREVMNDILAVDWLPFGQAVRRLSYPLEKLFLQHAGRRLFKRRSRRKRSKPRLRGKTKSRRRRRRPSLRAGKTRTHARPLPLRRARVVTAESRTTPAKYAAKRPTMLQRMLRLRN